jgi:hypothetical protein
VPHTPEDCKRGGILKRRPIRISSENVHANGIGYWGRVAILSWFPRLSSPSGSNADALPGESEPGLLKSAKAFSRGDIPSTIRVGKV